MPEDVSRRDWALGSLGLLGSAELASAWQHAHQAVSARTSPKFEYLAAGEARDIDAITGRIIPSGDTPGAREAGVIYFIDRALATWEADKRVAYRVGMDQLQRTRVRIFPESVSVRSLSEGQIDRLIAEIEKSDFFEMLRTHTVVGFFGSPIHGGNRGGVGWAHIGLEDRMIFEPPFGYYDAEATKAGDR